MLATSDIAKLRDLSRAERALLLRVLLMLPVAALAIQLFGLRRTQSMMLRADHGTRPGLDPRQIARIVGIAAHRGPFRATCLPTSITLQSLLARSGVAAQLRLGVRKLDGRLEAHAWVEHDGTALLEPAGVHERFTAFAGAIGAQRADGS